MSKKEMLPDADALSLHYVNEGYEAGRQDALAGKPQSSSLDEIGNDLYADAYVQGYASGKRELRRGQPS